MSIEKRLGKISRVRCGFCGYQDAMIGIEFYFDGDGWGIGGAFSGMWAVRSETATWTLGEQTEQFAEAMRLLRDTLTAAKKMDVSELVGVPVEVVITDRKLGSWRVLTEVL